MATNKDVRTKAQEILIGGYKLGLEISPMLLGHNRGVVLSALSSIVAGFARTGSVTIPQFVALVEMHLKIEADSKKEKKAL